MDEDPLADQFPIPAAPSLRRMVDWDANNQPILTLAPVFTKAQVAEIIDKAVAQPYVGSEPEFREMTNLEVMLLKLARNAAATGDRADIGDLLDRILGKPKFTGEMVSVTKSYESFLREKAQAVDVEVVDPLS